MGESPQRPSVIYYGLTTVHSSTSEMNLTFNNYINQPGYIKKWNWFPKNNKIVFQKITKRDSLYPSIAIGLGLYNS